MKQFKKLIAIISLLLSLCLMLTACGGVATQEVKKEQLVEKTDTVVPNQKQVSVLPTQLGITEDTMDRYVASYEEVARNSNSILYADVEKGLFALQNIETEKIWYSTPNSTEVDEFTSGAKRMEVRSQLHLYYIFREEENTTPSYKTENSLTGCVSGGSIKTTLIDNGFRVDYTFKKTKITIPVTYTLTADSLKVEILVEEIVEPDDVYLMGINLLPLFGAGYNNDEGDLFVPDGSGALIPFGIHNEMALPYDPLFYGEELAIKQEAPKMSTEPVRLPVFGTRSGNDALFGIVTKGDDSSGLSVTYGTENCGYTSVSSVMWYRTNDCKIMFSKGSGGISDTLYRVSQNHSTNKSYCVEYTLLNGEEANYVGMAKTYRAWLEENGIIKKTTEKPLFNLEVYGSAELTTSFLGLKYSKVEDLTSVKQAEEIVDILKEKGINNIGLRYMGFTGNGLLNKKVSTTVKPSSSLGSAKELVALGEKVTLYPDYDFVKVRSGGNGISIKKDILRTVFDYKGEQFTYSRSVNTKKISEDIIYILNGNAVLGSARKLLSQYSKSGYGNVSFSNIGSLLYSDFALENGTFRDETQDYFNQILAEFSESTESLAVDGGNAYTLKYADRIWSAPIYSAGYDIFSTDVPFYQIVLHGSVAITTPTVIQSTDPRTTILKAVETGSELLFGCTYEDSTELIGSRFENLYSTQYENWIDYALDAYNSYQPLLEKVYDKKIVSHSEVSNGVFVTTFENGVKVAVNYNDTNATLPTGETVESKGFCELNGGATNE